MNNSRYRGGADPYRRLLAYIPRSGTSFALNQITTGWGEVYAHDNVPFQTLSTFQAGQDEAKAAGRSVRDDGDVDVHSDQ